MSFGSGSADDPNPVWLQHMYKNWPKKNNWTECDYTDYPHWGEYTKNQSAKRKFGKTQCWFLDLT